MSDPPFPLAPRVATIGLSPILAAASRAAALRREGRTIVDLTLGEPEFPTPAHVVAAAHTAALAGETRYPPLTGTPALHAAIQAKLQRDAGLACATDEIIVGNGAKQVIFNAFMATLAPGDEVIMAAPYWTSYPDMVAFAGGTPVTVRTRIDGGWKISPAELAAAITGRTRWLLLNSPANPTGAVYTASELEALAEVLRRHPRIAVLSDDIYEHIRFAPEPLATMAVVAPDLRMRCLTVNGVSKAYAMTGWRIGYGVGPTWLIKGMAVVQSQATSGASSISQAAAAAALTGPQDAIATAVAAYRARRDLACATLMDSPGILVSPPAGAFYLLADCSALANRLFGDPHDDAALADLLLERHDLAVVPGSAFGAPGSIRLSLAASEAALRNGLRSLQRLAGG